MNIQIAFVPMPKFLTYESQLIGALKNILITWIICCVNGFQYEMFQDESTNFLYKLRIRAGSFAIHSNEANYLELQNPISSYVKDRHHRHDLPVVSMNTPELRQ